MTISIITVTYNSGKTIEYTLRSVLQQTYNDIDYCIVDGGSVDGTLDIIRRYEPLFNGRLHWISEADNGIYDAMNKGIDLATGDVVGILNSDDFFTSDDIVQRIADNFTDDIDAVYGDVHFVNDANPNKIVRYYSSSIFRPSLLRYGFTPAHPSFYARRDVYLRYGKYATQYKISADYEIMVRLFYVHRIKAKYIKMDFVTMRTGGVSTRSMRNRLLGTKEDVRACRDNGLYTNIFIISLKYFKKIFEYK